MSLDILQNMLDLLRPLSIYRLTEESFILKELKSYDKGFSPVLKKLENNLTEGFIQTSSGEALDMYEGACGCDFSAMTDAKRKLRLIYQLSVLPDAFSRDKVVHALYAAGYNGELTVDFEAECITFEDVDFCSNPEDYRWLAAAAEKLLPAHMEYTFKVEGYLWSQLDALDYSFAQLDQLNFRWNLLKL